MQSTSDWIGRMVDFDVHDVFIPMPTEVLMQRYGNQILQGQVVDLTPGGGPGAEPYAVLRVPGVNEFVIVPCARLRRPLLGPAA